MQIRPLGIDDYDEMMDLWRRSGISSLRPSGRDSREAFLRQLQRCSFAPLTTPTALGIEYNGGLIGVVIVTHDGRKGWINRLAIDPEYRRRGLAQQLIAAAEGMLREIGIRVTAVLVKRENEASLALFEQAGYELDQDICYLSKRDTREV